MRLAGKIALVTGTGPNIGGGIAEMLAQEGAAIVAADSSPDNAENCAADIAGRGGRAVGIACDVNVEAQVDAMIAAGIAAFGRIDLLVNNAAFFNKKGLLEMSIDEWRRQIGVILDGAFLCSRRIARHLIDTKAPGAILNIISTAGHQGEPGNIAYGTAKAGLINFTRSAAMELAPHGIRVNSLTPTATDMSEMQGRARRWGREQQTDRMSAVVERFRRHSPMQKLPNPSDYGRAAAFLLSDDAAMITGADLAVDAGTLAKYWAWSPGVTEGDNMSA